MRQPRRTDRYRPANLASASLPSWLDEETGRLDELEDPNMVELEPINIQGDPNAPEVVELAPFDIVGDVDAPPRRVGDYAPAPAGTRAPEEPKPMNGDWLDLVSTVLPEAVEDERTGLGGVEIPEWATRVIANDDGTMPTGALEAIGNLVNPAMVGGNMAGNIATQAAMNAGRDMRIAPEDRTVLAAPAVAGLANAGSLGFADDIAGLLSDDVVDATNLDIPSGDALRDQMRGGFDWAQREAPGSVAIGEDAAILAQMAVPGAPLRAGASPTARALATGAEGALMGGIEGFGRSDAETAGERLRDATPNAVMGGLVGGAIGRQAGRMQRAADTPVDTAAVQRLREDAAMDWLSHGAGGRDVVSQRLLLGGVRPEDAPGAALEAVERLRARDVIPPAQGGRLSRWRAIPDPEEMTQQGQRAGREGVQAIEQVAERMRQEPVLTDGLVARFQGRADEMSRSPALRAQRDEMQRYADEYAFDNEGGMVGWDDFQRWKSDFGDQSQYGDNMRTMAGNAYRDVRDEMQTLVDEAAPDLSDVYRQGRSDAQLGHVFDTVDGRRRLRDSRNRIGTLTNTITAGAGATTIAQLAGIAGMTAGPAAPLTMVGGIAAGAANNFARNNEHAIRAVNREMQVERLLARPEVAQRWASVLTEAQRRGPRAIAAALYLIQQRDPQARQAMQADEEQPETQDMPQMQPEQPAPIEDVENVPIDDLWAEEPITDVENVPIEELWQ